jgi:hypothetical protein
LADFFFLCHTSERIETFRNKEAPVPDSIDALKSQRFKLLQEFLSLGDLRPGSITAVFRRCGKPTCHCAKPDDAGHDPQFRLTRRVDGKTVTESFATPADLRRAQQEVSEFHRFRELSDQLVAVSEKICRLRPAAAEQGGWTESEKKLCSNPSGGHAGSQRADRPYLHGTAQNGSYRFGSRRDARAHSHA